MNKSKQKENIVAYFKQYPNYHPSAEDVYMYVKQKDEKIGIATIYRHLKRLVEEGVIGELNVEKQGVRYDLLDHEHYHFICESCKEITNFEYSTIQLANREIEAITNGKVHNKSVIVHGICEKCLEKN